MKRITIFGIVIFNMSWKSKICWKPLHNMEAYRAYKRKDRVVRILLLSSMRNDIMLRFERHRLAQVVWDVVKVQYGGTFTTKLHQLTLKFDGYKKRQNHTMRQHLPIMSNMISELKVAGHEMTNKQ